MQNRTVLNFLELFVLMAVCGCFVSIFSDIYSSFNSQLVLDSVARSKCLASICFAGCDSLNLPVDNALISATVQISLVRFPFLADDLIECAQSDGGIFFGALTRMKKAFCCAMNV